MSISVGAGHLGEGLEVSRSPYRHLSPSGKTKVVIERQRASQTPVVTDDCLPMLIIEARPFHDSLVLKPPVIDTSYLAPIESINQMYFLLFRDFTFPTCWPPMSDAALFKENLV